MQQVKDETPHCSTAEIGACVHVCITVYVFCGK